MKASERRKISCSKDYYSILLDCWDPSQLEFVEEFKVLLLSRASKVLGIVPISLGGIAGRLELLRKHSKSYYYMKISPQLNESLYTRTVRTVVREAHQ